MLLPNQNENNSNNRFLTMTWWLSFNPAWGLPAHDKMGSTPLDGPSVSSSPPHPPEGPQHPLTVPSPPSLYPQLSFYDKVFQKTYIIREYRDLKLKPMESLFLSLHSVDLKGLDPLRFLMRGTGWSAQSGHGRHAPAWPLPGTPPAACTWPDLWGPQVGWPEQCPPGQGLSMATWGDSLCDGCHDTHWTRVPPSPFTAQGCTQAPTAIHPERGTCWQPAALNQATGCAQVLSLCMI